MATFFRRIGHFKTVCNAMAKQSSELLFGKLHYWMAMSDNSMVSQVSALCMWQGQSSYPWLQNTHGVNECKIVMAIGIKISL